MNLKPIYVPILKWKQGEQGALKELDDSIKDKIIPLIEITPDLNFSKFKNTLNNWQNRYFYFDIMPEVYEEYDSVIYFDLLKQCDPDFVIPVLFVSDDKEVIEETAKYSNNGIAFRIFSNDFENLKDNLIKLEKVINFEDTDLIIDLKEITERNFSEKKIIIRALLPDIPKIKSFRNIIISSSAFPQSLSNLERYKIHYIERYDYKLWEELLPLENKYNIKFIYSDYCINHPSFLEYNPIMNPSFNIRYTIDNFFVIIRGISIRKGGLDPENIISLCDELTKLDDFSGQNFSWGDNYIFTRRENHEDVEGCGNLSTWRKVGTNHHITFVVNQISNLS